MTAPVCGRTLKKVCYFPPATYDPCDHVGKHDYCSGSKTLDGRRAGRWSAVRRNTDAPQAPADTEPTTCGKVLDPKYQHLGGLYGACDRRQDHGGHCSGDRNEGGLLRSRWLARQSNCAQPVATQPDPADCKCHPGYVCLDHRAGELGDAHSCEDEVSYLADGKPASKIAALDLPPPDSIREAHQRAANRYAKIQLDYRKGRGTPR